MPAILSFKAQANPDHAEFWELGTYPGGTWFSSWRLNDLGVIVGRGDVPGPDGVLSNHTLVVPLFGPHAGDWIDLKPLSGPQPHGWEEANNDISNTGLVVSSAIGTNGQLQAVAWTKSTDPIDLGTLADTGELQYASHNSSMAIGTNKLGTLIVGGSGVNGNTGAGFDAPVVWTPSITWEGGRFVTKWKIHKLDTTAFPDFRWVVWGVNDYRQIVGVGGNGDGTTMGALWNPRADGKGWKLVPLPAASGYSVTQPYGINEEGEIVGNVISVDWSKVLPAFWKPLDKKRATYSDVTMLPLPSGGFANCWAVGINDLGDMVGDCWDEAYTKDLPTRWSTRDLTFSELMYFPADWGLAWGVNNHRIVTVTYTGGEKCSAGVPWTYTCGGAIQLK